VLILLPVLAVTGLLWGLLVAGDTTAGAGGSSLLAAFGQALVFSLAAFGCWALGRELLPDDQAAAFVAMAFGVLTCLATTPGLMILFVCLGLVRMVNRSTGLAARTTDSMVLTVIVIWAIYATESPWLGGVAALAFVLDGVLKKPTRSQWLFGLICFGALVVYLVDHDGPVSPFVAPDSLAEWLTIMALVLFSLNLILLRKVHSRGDVDDVRLDIDRVKGGMAIAILCALQGLHHVNDVVLLVVTIGGLCFGIAFRRAFRSPAKGLRSN